MTSICPTCGFTIWRTSRHHCPPEWEVRCVEMYVDEWRRQRAHDAEDAASMWAEKFDEGEADLLKNSHGWLVEVREPGKPETTKRFRVTAEARVHYTANDEET